MYFKRQPINCPGCLSVWQSQPYFQGLALVSLLQEAFLNVHRSTC